MDHQIICNICGKSFSKKFALNRHRQLHNNETYSCATCAKVFVTKQYLEIHVLTHNTAKSFECDKCNQQFLTKSCIRKQTLSKHEDQSHVCEYCNKIVKRSDSLKKYVKLCQQKYLKTKQ